MSETIDQIRELYEREKSKNQKLMAVVEAARPFAWSEVPLVASSSWDCIVYAFNDLELKTGDFFRLHKALAALGER